MYPAPIEQSDTWWHASLREYVVAALAAGDVDAVGAALADVPEHMAFREVAQVLKEVGLELVPKRAPRRGSMRPAA